MAITRYAGDRFTVASTDTKPTGVMPGAFLIDSGSRTSYVKTGYTIDPWAQIAGGGGGGSPGGSDTQVQFNNNGSFGGDADLTFTNSNQLNVNKLSIAGNVIDSNSSIGNNGMVLTNEGTTGVHWKNIESVLSGVGGSGVANYVARWSDEDTLTSGTIYDDGNVGIGTIAPAAKLDVTHDGAWARLGYDSYATFQFYRNLPASSTSLPVMIVRQTHPDDDQTALIVDQDGSGNILELIEDSTTRVVVKADGKVGIGTTAPSRLLTVENNTSTVVNQSQLRINNAGAGDAYVYMYAGTDWSFGIDNSDADKFKFNTSNDVSDGTEVLTLQRDGNVGIGTDAPIHKFQVNGAAFISGSVIIPNASNYYGAYNAAGNDYIQAFRADGNDNLVVNHNNFQGDTIIKGDTIDLQPYDPLNVARSTLIVTGAGIGVPGSVGIGITNDVPQHTLHVSGDIQVSGYFYDSTSSTGVDGYVLTSKEDGPQWKMIEDVLSGVGGNGTANYIPKWEDSDTIGDSPIYTDGTDVAIGSTAFGVGGTQDLSIGNPGTTTGGITLWSTTSAAHSLGFGDANSGTARYEGYVEYSHGDNSMRLATSHAEQVRITSDGKVGIGTTAPTKLLHVEGSNPQIRLKSSDATDAIINIDAGAAKDAYLTFAQNGSAKWAVVNDYAGTDKLSIYNYANNANTVVFLPDGKVGIGTATPGIFTGFSNAGNYLTIFDTVAATVELARGSNNNNYAVGRVQFVNTNNADGANADADSKGIAYISAHVETTDSNAGDDSGGYLRFATKPEAGSAAEQMRIQGDGNVGINTLLPEHKLHVAGDAIISGYLYDSTNSTGVDGYVLTSREDGPQWDYIEDILSGVGGNGTENYVPKWEDSDTIGNSIIYDDGTNVGISTVTPSGKFHVYGGAGRFDVTNAATKDHHLTVSEGNATDWRPYAGSTTAALQLQSLENLTGDARGILLAVKSEGNPELTTSEGLDINVNATVGTNNGTLAVKVQSDGNVGIGTTNPGGRLETYVTAGGQFGLRLNSNFGGGNAVDFKPYISSVSNAGFSIDLATSTKFVINSDGNVGVGTNNPLWKFQVDGPAFVSGTVLIPNSSNYYGAYNAAGTDYIKALYVDTNDDVIVNHTNFQGNTIIRGDTLDVQPYDPLNVARSTLIVTGAGVGVPGSVGIGITTKLPQHTLHVSGDMQVSGYFYDSTSSTGVDGYVLTSKEDGPQWKMIEDVLSGVGGNGTADYVPRWVDSDTIGDSVIAQSGSAIGIGTAAPAEILEIVSDSDPTILIRPVTVDSANSGKISYRENAGGTTGVDLRYDGANNKFIIDTSDVANALVIKRTDGKVGIGVAAPVAKVHIDDSATGDNKALYLSNTHNTDGDSAAIRFGFAGNDNANKGGIFFQRTANYGRGSLIFATENTQTNDNVDASDTKLIILADGKVGIGTTAPSAALDVVTSSTVWAAEINQTNTSNGDGLYVNTGSTASADYVASFRANNVNVLAVKANGKVGIGTATPDSLLQIANANGSSYRFGYAGTSDVYFDADDVYFRSDNGGVNNMVLKGSKLGIGTASPGSILEVRGATETIPNLGTYGTFFNLRRTDGHIGLSIGIDSSTNNFWFQGQNSTSPIPQKLLSIDLPYERDDGSSRHRN